MKLMCKGKYHNQPVGMHFDGPGLIEIDEAKAQFLLRDAPENFDVAVETLTPAPLPKVEGIEEPPVDKMVKAPSRKKGV